VTHSYRLRRFESLRTSDQEVGRVEQFVAQNRRLNRYIYGATNPRFAAVGRLGIVLLLIFDALPACSRVWSSYGFVAIAGQNGLSVRRAGFRIIAS
jgi:hypothetical protein